jgi:hypothetical protein
MDDIIKEKFPALNEFIEIVSELSSMKVIITPAVEFNINNIYHNTILHPEKMGYNQKKANFIKKKIKSPQEMEAEISDIPDLPKLEEMAEKIIKDKVIPSIKSKNTFPALTRKELEYLSAYKYFPTRYKPEYLHFLKMFVDKKPLRSRVFMCHLSVYFYNYNKFINDERLMQMFDRLWNNCKKNNRTLREGISFILENKTIYLSKNAPAKIAEMVLNRKLMERENLICDINELYTRNIDGDFLSETYKHLGLSCFKRCNESFYLDILLNEIISNSPISKKQLDELVSKVILAFSDSSDVNAQVQEKIRKCLLLHKQYGDPRINELNWQSVDLKAKQMFKNWLSKVDLEFFFNVIFDDVNDYQQRKPFWEQYISSLINSRVIISTTHKQLNALELKKAKEEGRTFAEFVYDSQSSCFVMDFGKFYVVEFCESGNAAYIYSKNALKIDISKKKISENLRDSRKAHLVKVDEIFEDKDKIYIRDLNTLSDIPILRFAHLTNLYDDVWDNKKNMVWHKMVKCYLESMGIYPEPIINKSAQYELNVQNKQSNQSHQKVINGTNDSKYTKTNIKHSYNNGIHSSANEIASLIIDILERYPSNSCDQKSLTIMIYEHLAIPQASSLHKQKFDERIIRAIEKLLNRKAIKKRNEFIYLLESK